MSHAPIACVLAVVIRDDNVLLVRRANPPDRGKWGFPGGKVDLGEAVYVAAARELAEETAVTGEPVEPLAVIDVFERVDEADAQSPLKRHFILIAISCRWLSGEPVAGDDALEAAWWPLDSLPDLDASARVEEVAKLAAGRRS